MIPLRGNLDTRLKKLNTMNLDAIVLALAGVKRLGFDEKITEKNLSRVLFCFIPQKK
jgi:hydroxymethylbilane synthase